MAITINQIRLTMTIETKKLTAVITSIILLSSVSGLAIQVQSVDAGAVPQIVDGDILIALEETGGGPGIIMVDPVTGVQTFVFGFADVMVDVKIDSNEDLIIATENDIINFNPVSVIETIITTAGLDILNAPIAMDLNSAGDIIVLDDDIVGNGIIVSVDPVLGTETLLISNSIISGSQGIAVESSGDIIVLGGDSLYRVDPIASTVTLLSSDIFGGIEVIAINDAGDIFTGGTEVVKTDPVTGISTTISSGFNNILGIGIESDGNIIAVDSDINTIVYRVDPVSGAQTALSTDGFLVNTVASALTVKTAGVPIITCQGQVATIVGTDGPDFITGTAGDDVIDGLNGDDVISGLDGNDIICGGGGNDFIDAGNGNDSVKGNGGKDVIIGNEGNDFLRGDGGKDNINGGSGNDIIEGGDNDDIIIGGSEDDVMDGGLGIDLCEVEPNDTATDCETITVP